MKKVSVFFVFTCVMGLMFTSVSAQEVSIPAWIKNNAGWWADDQIPDSTFLDGIEYLIEVGIIILQPTDFVTQPSDLKLFDSSSIVEGVFSLPVKIHYMETIEIGVDGEEFTQIWIEVHTVTKEILGLALLKLSETIIDEYDDKKLILIEGLTKSDDIINTTYLFVEEHENNRMIKYIEYDTDDLFRQLVQPQNFIMQDGIVSVTQYDFQLRDKFEDKYRKLGFTEGANKTIVIIPTFTASAYSKNGFYDFYSGNCDETCLTVPITNSIKDFSYTSSANAIIILDLLGYESITDRQLHSNPNVLDRYDHVIVLHNEYVSRTMFNAITSHDNVVFLYPNALYAQVNVDTTNNLITLVRGHNYPESYIINGFDWKNENTHPYEYDTECQNWEFYPTKGTPNGYMLNCYPENIIWKDELFLKTLKDLVS